MFIRFRNFWLVMVKLCRSILDQRQTPAPNHIGPYGGSFVDVHQDDKH
jgi:hypothetical protein